MYKKNLKNHKHQRNFYLRRLHKNEKQKNSTQQTYEKEEHCVSFFKRKEFKERIFQIYFLSRETVPVKKTLHKNRRSSLERNKREKKKISFSRQIFIRNYLSLNNLLKTKSVRNRSILGHESDSLLLFILHPSHRAKFPPSILFLSPSRACNVLNEDECIPVKSHALHSGCVLRGLSGGRSDSPYRGIAQRHIMRLWWNQSLASCGWWLVVDPSVRPRKRVSAQRCTVSSPFHVAEILPIDHDRTHRSIISLSFSLYIYPSLSILFGAPPPRCTIAHVPWRILENFSVDPCSIHGCWG